MGHKLPLKYIERQERSLQMQTWWVFERVGVIRSCGLPSFPLSTVPSISSLFTSSAIMFRWTTESPYFNVFTFYSHYFLMLCYSHAKMFYPFSQAFRLKKKLIYCKFPTWRIYFGLFPFLFFYFILISQILNDLIPFHPERLTDHLFIITNNFIIWHLWILFFSNFIIRI